MRNLPIIFVNKQSVDKNSQTKRFLSQFFYFHNLFLFSPLTDFKKLYSIIFLSGKYLKGKYHVFILHFHVKKIQS